MTPERNQRIRQVLDRRQLDLTVCMERVHKAHNIAAVLRSCDAVGIHKMHAVWDEKPRMRRGTAKGSQNWVSVESHESIQDAVSCLKQQGMQILVTNLSDKAVDFRDIDYTRPTAIILGQEKDGITQDAIAMADHEIVIPMMGMVQSLNVSVAAALILYEAQHQRDKAGLYQHPKLDQTEYQRILFEGGYPNLVQLCQRKQLPYPYVDEDGQIQADDTWWQQMQLTPAGLAKLEAEQVARADKNDIVDLEL